MTDIIAGRIIQEKPGTKPKEIFDYEKKEFIIERG
jgi:hypothetical protein